MKGSDVVDLIIVTHSNYLAMRTTRLDASGWIRQWYHAREHVRNGDVPCPSCEEGKKLEDFMSLTTRGTIAANFPLEEGGDVALWAVGWEFVVAMYTRDPSTDHQKKIAEAQKKIADAIEKQMDQGEDWKKESDN